MSVVFPVNADPRFRITTTSAGQSLISVPFPFQSADDITVEKETTSHVKSTLIRGTHYTLAGAGNPLGGNVTLKPAFLAKSGEIYTIIGKAVLTRAAAVTQGGKFSSTQLDTDLDRLTIIAQEHERDLGRALKAGYGVTPPAVTIGAAGTVPVWDADGNLAEGPAAAAIEAIEVALGVEAGRALIHGAGGSDPYAAGSRRINGLADGTESTDAATKGQLDTAIADVTGDIDPEGITARLDALEATVGTLVEPGDIKLTMRAYASDPDGWLLLTTTRTIGSASSGAAVADAGVENCFLAVWAAFDNTQCPIFTSAGEATTRGASAAADFAADKRLQLPTPADRFVRFASGTRALGLKEANQNKQHNHSASFAGTPLPTHTHTIVAGGNDAGNGGASQVALNPNGTQTTSPVSAGTPAGSVTVNNDGGSEARPDSFVLTALIRL